MKETNLDFLMNNNFNYINDSIMIVDIKFDNIQYRYDNAWGYKYYDADYHFIENGVEHIDVKNGLLVVNENNIAWLFVDIWAAEDPFRSYMIEIKLPVNEFK